MPAGRRLALTVASVLATTLMAVDITIASVALPEIQGTFAITADQVAWVLTSYVIALAIVTPAVDPIVERIGRRRAFLMAVGGFTGFSALCGFAWSIESLAVFRFLQGVFAAGLVPIAQAVLLDSHPPEKHGSAMAWWTTGVMVGPIIGPLLGGWLTEEYGWRWIFWINLPFGAFALFVIAAFQTGARSARPRRFDAPSYVLLAVAIACLQFVVERGERFDWFESTTIVACLGVAAACVWAFVARSWTSGEPFFSPALFRDSNFVACTVVTFVTSGVFYANLALIAPFLQTVLGYPADATGAMIAPRGLGVLTGVALANGLRRWFSDRVIVIAGLAGSAASIHAMTYFSLQVDVYTITWTGIVQGFCYGVMFGPLTTATFATLAASLRTEGAALVQLLRQISGGIGIAAAVALLTRYGHGFDQWLRGIVEPEAARHWLQAGTQGRAMLAREVARQGAMLAYLRTIDWLAASIVVTLPLVLAIRPARGGSPPAAPPVEPPA
jgi:DHA2 family multidrug resistance protein